MRITAIRDIVAPIKTAIRHIVAPIKSDIANAYIDFPP